MSIQLLPFYLTTLMDFKKAYFISTILSFFAIIFHICNIDRIFYLLCELLHANFPSIAQCLFAKNLTIYIFAGVLFSWFVLSGLAIYRMENENRYDFKKIYLTTVLCFFFVPFFLILFGHTLIDLLHGYDSYIIETDANYAWEAFGATRITKFAVFYIVWGINAFCFVLSCIAMYRRIYSIYFNLLIFILSLSMNLFFIAILLMFMKIV